MARDLTPDHVSESSFSDALWGYKKEEVDSYLEDVADAWGGSLRSAREEAFHDLGERMGELLQHAKDTAEQIVAEAEQEAARVRAQAGADAEETVATARSTADVTLAQAHQDADQRIADAEDRVQALGVEEGRARDRIGELREALDDLSRQMAPFTQPPALVIPEAETVPAEDAPAPEPVT